jgi:Protein of unknown function (DUF1566)
VAFFRNDYRIRLDRQTNAKWEISMRVFSMMVVAALAPGASVSQIATAAPQGINDTGLVQCLTAQDEWTTECAGSGQDAETGRDATHPKMKDGWAGFAFVRVCHSGERAGTGNCPAVPAEGNGPSDWGCTEDKVTGLMWEIKTASGLHQGSNTYRYTLPDDGSDVPNVPAFVEQVNAENLCGHSDWRVPSSSELLSMMRYGKLGQRWAFNVEFFPNIAMNMRSPWNVQFWTSTPSLPLAPDQRNWIISFGSGTLDDSDTAKRTPRAMLVRQSADGSTATGERFKVHGSEVSDRLAKLVWRRCPEGQRFNDGACTGTAKQVTWMQALRHAANESARTGIVWRVPNLRELESIVDRARYNPAVDTDVFPWPTPYAFWSSTARARTGRGSVFVWQVRTEIGTFSAAYRRYDGNVILVRALHEPSGHLTAVGPAHQ